MISLQFTPRANWALEGDVRLLIVALGANDGLRGLPASQMKANLRSIIHRARQRASPRARQYGMTGSRS